jgi:dihydrolipoamide dehydrogenase
MKEFFDVIVIGGGPGGYVAAIRGAQLGLKVLCVDKRASLGGTCLNVGCIPSKALLLSSEKFFEAKNSLSHHGIDVKGVKLDLAKMLSRKDQIVADLTKGIQFLFKKNGVTFVNGSAAFVSSDTIRVGDDEYRAKHIVIATGSAPTSLPGIDVDEKTVVSSTGALSLKEVPENLVIIGAGYIGLELGSVWMRLGAKVTVIEYADKIVPAMDDDLSKALHKSLKNHGMEFMLSTKVTGINKNSSGVGVEVSFESIASGETGKINASVLLSCAGRRPFTDGLGLDSIGVSCDQSGRVIVDKSYCSSIPGIYAIGDVIAGPMLAHKAEEEGVALMEMISGQKPHVNYGVIPAVIYTMPEVASVGRTESELKKDGVSYKVGKFPFSANSRARATGEVEGFVKILSDLQTDEIYGIHIIHACAGTMIAEAALAMEYRASSEDIARTCHAHPTLSEGVKEAALDVLGRAIHI